ncbi:hypothetical protein [Paenibacillus sacheonensis]|uniref:Uncharacterized protein n=1 Tax=Paenibacillus sacheonensis TaxID=742054 RepID=A0A7X4YSA0_9BACL|nr:hypothetical protein [Paenibacillus sacheonensis]NBC71560.1 hypothetical protein [Paenibacillus sacheonensis]
MSFWRGADGAVSLYLIVSTAAMLLFTSLLVDYARIAAFDKQTELAAQSGIRSALSAYDQSLYERYGLFGAGGSDRGELFAQAAEHNWLDGDVNHFQWLRIQREASHVDTEEVLGNQVVFTRQVLEEMKYKAPIDFTMEIVSRFAPMSAAMKEASATIGGLEDIKRLYEDREEHLERASELQKEAAARVSELSGALSAASGIVDGYGAYESWRAEDAGLEEDEKPKHAEDIASYSVRSQGDAAAVLSAADSGLEQHADDTAKALSELMAAEQSNAAIAAAAERMRQSQETSGYDKLSDANVAGKDSTSMTAEELSQYGQTRASAEGLVLDEAWFADYRRELNEQLSAYRSIRADSAAFQSVVRSAVSSTGMAAGLNEAWSDLNGTVHRYEAGYSVSGTVMQARKNEFQRRHAHDAERKSNEAAAKTKWSEVKSMLGGLQSDPGQAEQKQAFEEVKRLAADNLRFNQAAGEETGSSPDAGRADDAGDEAKSALTSMGTMFGGMAELLEGIRDPLYVNEYVVHRFRSFDPTKLRGMISDGGQGDRASFSKALALENQEVEYILYGFHEPGANIAAAVGEIFAARLAVRTMEGLIACRALGHPLLILSAAVLYGLEKAIADMAVLSEKGKVQLSKYVPSELTYADYLRVFLILHGSGGQARNSRIIAVIERNTGADLSMAATGLSGEMTSSVNLWFLPGLMRTFTAAGILNGKVKDGRYEKTQTIGSSYG